MLVLIIGGSGSGKSAYAEKRAHEFAGEISCGKDAGQKASTASEDDKHRGQSRRPKYYLATMAVRRDDAEMQRKVRRHQEIRAGKGWSTIECPVDIGRAAEEIFSVSPENGSSFSLCCISGQYYSGGDSRKRVPLWDPEPVVLLEDLGNLVANEMFRDGGFFPTAETVRKIDPELMQLEAVSKDLIIVSNQVFSDGCIYDPGTEAYIAALGQLHQRIASRASEVIEVVVGIPIRYQ